MPLSTTDAPPSSDTRPSPDRPPSPGLAGRPASLSSGLAGGLTRSAASRSIAHRNAARVLPDPVGADMSTCSPEAMAGHASSWAAVGAANAASNQARVLPVKCSRAIAVVSVARGLFVANRHNAEPAQPPITVSRPETANGRTAGYLAHAHRAGCLRRHVHDAHVRVGAPPPGLHPCLRVR